jgi:MFS family permease
MFFSSGNFWKVGLVPQAIANGLSNILVLFFVISRLHGTLLDIGLVTGIMALALVPSQMLWGRLIDSVGRCKPFLILGYLGMGISLIAISWVSSVWQLLVLVSLKSVLYSATIPARQLLTVESEQREGWRRGIANMQFLTTLGETLGMGIGAAAMVTMGFSQLFFMCGILAMVSAMALGILAQEPGFMIQRRLVALERSTSILIATSDFVGYQERLPQRPSYGKIMGLLNRSTKFLMIGIFGFSLAGSAFYSPLPAYFIQFCSSQVAFLILFVGSLVGTICYLLVGRLGQSAARSLVIASSMRILVIPLLLVSAIGATTGLVLAAVVLAVLEGLWSLFDVSSTFAFLETAQMGRAGFYGALVGLGSAGGGFLGGFVSQQFGFGSLFVLCSVLCAGALVAFVLQFKHAS